MHSNKRSSVGEVIGVLTLLFVSILSIHLQIRGELTLYIHPRYVLFTVAMSIIGVVASTVYLVTQYRDGLRSNVPIAGALSLLFMAVLVQLPPKDLSSSLAQNRTRNSSVGSTATKKIVLSRNTENLKLADWDSLIAQTVDVSSLIERKIHVSGFILPHDDDYFSVARFVVTCCAVDAQPIFMYVYMPDWKSRYSADEWVEVKGTTKDFGDIGVGIMPEAVTVIERPKDPYAY